jgi:Flp pilus assembly protein TadD
VFSRPERWYSLGLAHLAAGNGEKALTVLRMAAKETAGDAPLLIAAGRACAVTGELVSESLVSCEGGLSKF